MSKKRKYWEAELLAFKAGIAAQVVACHACGLMRVVGYPVKKAEESEP